MRKLCFILTGGPCGGKTTLMHELRAKDPRAEQWILVPEAAPLLFSAGLNGREKSFQRAVVQLQLSVEDICASVSRPGQVLLCHRGALDPLAYWLRNGWDEDEFFRLIGISQETIYQRYSGVIHLQSTANGAESFYKRWPYAHRPETIEQAALTDQLCAHVWKEHPRYLLIENHNRDWYAKSQLAQEILRSWANISDQLR